MRRPTVYYGLPKFQDHDELICSIPQQKGLKKKFNYNNPVDTGIQNTLEVAGTYVTTDNPRSVHIGITHAGKINPRIVQVKWDPNKNSQFLL